MTKDTMNILISVDLCESFIKNEYIWQRILEILRDLSSEEWLKYLDSFDTCFHIFDFNWLSKDQLENTWMNEHSWDYWLYKLEYHYDEETEQETIEFWDDNSYIKYFLWNWIEKEYWFFRDLINSWYDNWFLITLWKFMLKNNINMLDDIKSIKDVDIHKEDEKLIFDTIDTLNWLSFYFPLDLIKKIENTLPNKDITITLIWWWEHECLKEIYLLLKILWYDNITLNKKYMY